MSAEEIAGAFMQHYYGTLDSNIAGLGPLYKDTSMLTFEGQQFMGVANISQKMASLGKLAHNVQRFDVQPSVDPNNLVIFVVGQVKLEGQDNPLQFAEVFQLVANAPGSYSIHNQMFRLIYG